MPRKIITYFLIIAVVLPVFASVVPFGTTIKRAEAADNPTELTSSDGKVYDPCGWTAGIWSGRKGECLSYQIASILYEWVLQGAILIAGLAGNLFNASVQFSLTGAIFDADKNIMIKDGWTLVRDLLNLVFIFILLFAAVSTILQYGNFEIKKVLPGLIVAALLVNFSMMITKMVIDASHIFAWEFYNRIDVKNENKLGDGQILADMKNDIEVYGDFAKKNLANTFMAGFNPQELLIGKDSDDPADQPQWRQVVQKNIDEGKSISDVWWQMGLIILLESALAIFAGFVLLAGAIMFIARVVILWLVMIFSPIAFLSMILPRMGEYSSKWWNYLIGQSFFAPAFLFMFMLVAEFINSDFVGSIFETSSTSDSFIILGINGGAIALTFFHFFVVAGLMMACLVVARQLGGKTAEFGINWAHKGKDLALGGVNKLAWKPTRLGLRYAGGAAGDSNWWAKSIGRIPGGGMLGRKLGAMKKADEDKARKAAEKSGGKLSSAGRASLDRDLEGGFVKRFMYTGPLGASKAGREGYEKIITKKKAEEEEEKRVLGKVMELMGGEKEFFDKLADIKNGDTGEIIKQKRDAAKKKAKNLLRQGDTAGLDKLIEEKDQLIIEDNKLEKEKINVEKRQLTVEIEVKKNALKKATESGGNVPLLKSELISLEKELDEQNKKLAELVVKEKHRENLQKTVDKYIDRQRAKLGKPEERKEEKTKKP